MKGRPEPGDVLLWRGSHDVLGTRGPVILVEQSIDPQFWVVAALDERGRPTPYTFAVPAEDLHPNRSVPRLLDDPVRGAMLRVAVSAAAVASFALGALSLFGAQPATPMAEGPRPTQAAQIADATAPSTVPELGDIPRRLRYPPFRSFQGESSREIEAPAESSSGTAAIALAMPSTAGAGGGGSAGAGTSGGTVSGGSGGGGSSGNGTDGGTTVRSEGPPETRPGNSASAPGHDSPRGNSASAPGHDSPRGNSASAPGHD